MHPAYAIFTLILLFHASHWWLARRALTAASSNPEGTNSPSVAVVRPIFGCQDDTLPALESLLFVAPPDPLPQECVFSFQRPDDPALAVAHQLTRQAVDRAQIVVAPVMPGTSPKASNLIHGLAVTTAPRIVLADADVIFPPRSLSRLLAPLDQADVGMVAAIPVFHGAVGLWANLYQAHMNSTILLEWLPYTSLGRTYGAPGAAVALRREAFEKAGGSAVWADTLADDFRLGQAIRQAGYQIQPGPSLSMATGFCDWNRLESLLERAAVLFGGAMPRPLLIAHLLANYSYLVGLMVPQWRGIALAYLVVRSATYALLERRWQKGMWIPLLDGVTVYVWLRTWITRKVTWEGIRYSIDCHGRLRRSP